MPRQKLVHDWSWAPIALQKFTAHVCYLAIQFIKFEFMGTLNVQNIEFIESIFWHYWHFCVPVMTKIDQLLNSVKLHKFTLLRGRFKRPPGGDWITVQDIMDVTKKQIRKLNTLTKILVTKVKGANWYPNLPNNRPAWFQNSTIT
jgi:hypothetical protein